MSGDYLVLVFPGRRSGDPWTWGVLVGSQVLRGGLEPDEASARTRAYEARDALLADARATPPG